LLNPDADLGGLDPRWVAEEIARCQRDPEYFVDNFCMVESDAGDGVVPFHLFDYQRDVLHRWLAHRETITLKARQLGITELAAALALAQVNFRGHNKVIVFSQDESKAREFSRKCRVAWDNLPAWLQTPLSNPQLTTTLELRNGSRIIPQAATERSARGLNCQLLILDEFAFQEYGGSIFEAAAVTARSAGQRILVISTANGAGTPFHILWQQAVTGESSMHAVFLPWHIRPGRDAAWYQQATANYEVYKAAQEYPARAEEAFILSGRSRFDLDDLDAVLAGCAEPIATELDGGLTIWQMPYSGGRYVIGADTSEGLPKGDYSAAVVLDQQSGAQVAALHGRWSPEVFAQHLADVGVFYNSALIGVERNLHGHSVLLELGTHHGYGNLYHHTDYDATGNATARVGFPTTSKTKPIMIDALSQTFHDRWGWRDAALLGEARTYVLLPNGGTAASGNLKDDRVMAASIATMMRSFVPATRQVISLHDELAAIRPEQWAGIERQWHQEVRTLEQQAVPAGLSVSGYDDSEAGLGGMYGANEWSCDPRY